jgi:hypothetical protein
LSKSVQCETLAHSFGLNTTLFDTRYFLIETRHEGSEEYAVAVYQTSQPTALQRVESAIGRLKGHTSIWAYLHPLEVLRDELKRCPPDESIELDVTQFWAKDETFRRRVTLGAASFANMLDALTGDEQQDLAMLDALVGDLNVASISSVANLNPEDRMFVLIGTYWGNEELEDLYSLEYFSEEYWTADP